METKIICPITTADTAVGATSKAVTFAKPITFSEYTNGAKIYVEFFNFVGGSSSGAPTATLRINAKNSSNTAVNIDAGAFTTVGGSTQYRHCVATILLKSNGSGIISYLYGPAGNNGSPTGTGQQSSFTSSTISQVTGFTIVFSASTAITRGAYVTIEGLK